MLRKIENNETLKCVKGGENFIENLYYPVENGKIKDCNGKSYEAFFIKNIDESLRLVGEKEKFKLEKKETRNAQMEVTGTVCLPINREDLIRNLGIEKQKDFTLEEITEMLEEKLKKENKTIEEHFEIETINELSNGDMIDKVIDNLGDPYELINEMVNRGDLKPYEVVDGVANEHNLKEIFYNLDNKEILDCDLILKSIKELEFSDSALIEFVKENERGVYDAIAEIGEVGIWSTVEELFEENKDVIFDYMKDQF